MEGSVVRRLGGRVAVVTGSARGIGAAIAARLADEGADLALLDVASMPAELIDSLAAKGQAVEQYEVDVTDRAAVRGVAGALGERFGRVDVVVNDAAVAPPGSVEETTDDVWDAVVDVNARGPLVVAQEVLDLMSSGGSIVNMASIAAFMANSSQVAYAASKGALVALTRNMAFELAPRGIRVNAVAPGPTDTPALATLDEESLAARLERIPLGRFGRPEELAAAVAFLASDDASFITGAVLVADGGLSIAGLR